jgi:hypothetical protein
LKPNRRIRSEVPQDESQVSVGGFLSLGYGMKKKVKNEEKERGIYEICRRHGD